MNAGYGRMENVMKNIRAIIMLILCAVVLSLSLASCGGGDEVAVDGEIYADIIIKNYGTVTVKLDSDAAPITVANFVKLAEDGFYKGLKFHRIMEGFMMQGGNGEPAGKSASSIKGEFSENGVENPLSHTRGAISMARTDVMDSASSQFFIVHEDSIFLDGKYAAFGYVTEGMDIVDKICVSSRPVDNNGTILEANQPIIEDIVIRK